MRGEVDVIKSAVGASVIRANNGDDDYILSI